MPKRLCYVYHIFDRIRHRPDIVFISTDWLIVIDLMIYMGPEVVPKDSPSKKKEHWLKKLKAEHK